MLQGGEIIIIALLALVVLGPRRLPELARKIGEWSSELRKAARDITAGLEAEVDDLKKVGDDLKAPIDEISKGFDWTGPKPVSGPTPEDAMKDLEAIEAAGEIEEPEPTDEDADRESE